MSDLMPLPQGWADAPLAQLRALSAASRFADAEALGRQLLARDPRQGQVWFELARLALLGGRPDLAIERLQRTVDCSPDGQTLGEVGQMWLMLRRPRDAEPALRRAIELEPDVASHHNNLGAALKRSGQLEAAGACFRRAIELDPALVSARSNLASTLRDGGEFAAAVREYEQALAIEPANLVLRSNLLFSLTHLEGLSADALYERHREQGLAFEHGAEAPTFAALREPGKARLRIGFVSADLRDHALAYFINPVWRHLDRWRFEIHVYANDAMPADAVTQSLRPLCQRWTDVHGLSDEALTERIRADAIDLLIDLSGHTAGNRLGVFARRAAPIQASWIGYPCTTGLSAMDYFLTDEVMAPSGACDEQFVEKLVRLPAAVTFEPPIEAPAVKPLPALVSGRLVFGSFHRVAKLGDNTLRLWADVLRAVPESTLVIGHCDDAALASSIRTRIAAGGVDPARLSFRPRLPLADFLALHHEVDLVLDACTFSGGTTTAIALWMGVPVLTLAGATMPGRQSAAVLHHTGLSGFIADSTQQLVEMARHWSTRIDELAALRAGMRGRIAALPLLREQQVAHGFEQALEAMWSRWVAGQAPVALYCSGGPSGVTPAAKAC